MSKFIASPLSRLDIREYANRVRKCFIDTELFNINMVKLLDIISIEFEKVGLKFDYVILPDDSPLFEMNEEAFTNLQTGVICFKESIIQSACKKRYTRSSFTIAHELGHYFLHFLQPDIKLSRISDDYSVPPYKNPEWQADTFASEFLMPFQQCKDMDEETIRKKYRVSRLAATTKKKMILKELNK